MEQHFPDIYNYVLIPGYGGIEMKHWMRHWMRVLPNVSIVKQKDFQNPVLEDWIDSLQKKVAVSDKPVIAIGHSLGAHTLYNADIQGKITGVKAGLLVAPPEEKRSEFHDGSWVGFTPFPMEKSTIKSVLVYSESDEYATMKASLEMAKNWGCKAINAGNVGHIGSDANLASWDDGQGYLSNLIKEL
ncbi:RBBP9/YdeN family alpha/beta hydrolase [Luteibaculum oceani]|uniref:Alpha/beta hydrolase n=1 Tax=Luteibaculum oceani TaxID=1294296 RepID=A0A5C6VKL4_9FLAO|nr:alpha/beta hydrolase [Luteibaculum oceani]TXC85261.1 hypothetical protein FRX97_01155 [Luteibaculum oceani]